MTNSFSLIVPTYNRQRLLRETLASIAAMNVPVGASIELIVINNNCTDATAEVVDRAVSAIPIRMIVETRQGLCHCRNRALEEARYEHVIYLDDDIRVSPHWIDGYRVAMEQFGADCVVGPVYPLFESKPPEYCTQAILDSVSSTYSHKGPQSMLLGREVAHEVPGCNFGVRKSVALEIGGFDPGLDRNGCGLLAGGDFEFGMRLVRSGKAVVYHPRCWIEHIITPEKLSKIYLRKRWYGVGMTQRALNATYGLSTSRQVRATLGAARLGLSAISRRLAGDEPRAFELELRARRSWGYLHRP